MAELSATLPPMTERQMAYATRHCFDHKAVKRSNGYYCTHCGEDSKTLSKKCPHCGYELTPMETRSRKMKGNEYYAIVAKCAEFQVIRIFMVYTAIRVGNRAEYEFCEVVQQWIDTKGSITYMTKRRNMCSYYVDQWLKESQLEIRDRNPYGAYDPNPVVYPYKSVTAEIKRNGFTGDFFGIAPNAFFSAILRDNRAETLLRMGQIEIFREAVISGTSLKYWPSILICQRHGYIIKDGRNWSDMMSLLERLGKDIRSPKYIMPTDIKAAHAHWRKKLHDRQNKERVERELSELREAKENEVKFREMKGKFFGVSVSENDITISVLESVKDHILEGKALCHCVGHCGYAMREKSLILTAVVNGVKTETIEINLDRMEIVQCRGMQNQASPYHEKIVSLMNRNIHLIKERMTA